MEKERGDARNRLRGEESASDKAIKAKKRKPENGKQESRNRKAIWGERESGKSRKTESDQDERAKARSENDESGKQKRR